MYRIYFFFLLIALSISAGSVASVRAQNFNIDEVSFSVEPGSMISILGISRSGPFRCESTQVTGGGRAGISHEETGEPFVDAKVTVPVRAFDCGNRKKSSELRQALNYGDNPSISFTINEAFARSATEFEGGDYSLRTSGQLTIAGVEQPVELHLIAEREGFFTFRLTGKHEILLTDYGIDPSKALQLLSANSNSVTMEIDLILSPKIGF